MYYLINITFLVSFNHCILCAGCPVWRASGGPVNTCSELDWVRSLAAHLWYLSHPLASVPDALHQFEVAWRGAGPEGSYCSAPAPEYSGDTADTAHQDIRYQLLRLYCDRSTALEAVCDPSSHTRVSWLVLRVLEEPGQRLPAVLQPGLHTRRKSKCQK